MFRSYTLTFLGNPRSSHAEHAHESHMGMLFPLGVLSLLSLVVGWLEIPHMFGHMQYFTEWVQSSWIHAPTATAEVVANESTEWMLMGLATVGSLVSAGI